MYNYPTRHTVDTYLRRWSARECCTLYTAVTVYLLSPHHTTTITSEIIIPTTTTTTGTLAPDDILERVSLVTLLTDSLATTVEEYQGDTQGYEEGEEAVDDVDREMSRAKPGSS